MKRILLLSSVSAAVALCASVPQVSDVSMTQSRGSRLVTVSYKVDAPAIVTFDIQTNGVSIGAVNLTNAYGDVNRRIDKIGETCKINWQPLDSWPNNIVRDKAAKAVVTAWSLKSPPDYMAVSLASRSNVTFYASADAVPAGVTSIVYKTSVIMMRRIHAAGVRFRMGSTIDETGRENREYPHDVTFTNDYYMGIYPLTVNQLERVMGSNAAGNTRFAKCANGSLRPASNFSYALLRGTWWSSTNTSHAVKTDDGYYLASFRRVAGIEFDMPTEAQWEFACRAGTTSAFNDGTGSMDDVGWNNSNWQNDPNCTSNETHVVGLLKPNAWGLYDMHGNIGEKCLDWFSSGTYYTDGTEAVEPPGSDKSRETGDGVNYRVVRGGNWNVGAADCRSAKRGFQSHWEGTGTVGVRFCCPVQFPY